MELDKPSWASRSTLVKNQDENKTYVLVRLSESFSNAIQEYSAAQNNNNINQNQNNHHPPHHHQNQNQNQNHHHQPNNHQQKYNNTVKTKHYNNSLINNTKEPTIKFQGTRGVIKFPDGKCYDFSLEQSDNSVECIKQTKTRWETVGKMACCLQVKGKDDVYQMTKTKLKAAEQEKRKYCAKLLGSPEHNNTISNNSNKKTKLLNNSNSTKPIQPPTIIPPSSNNITQISSQHQHQKHQQHHNHHQQQQQLSPPVQSPPPPPPPSSVTKTNINNTTNNNNNINNAIPHQHQHLPPHPHPHPDNKYPDIMDVKQLKKYKAEFDKDFQEYQNLHGYLHRIEERFRKLRELLKQSVEGSSEWESAKEQIFNEYERVKSDSNFHIARREYKQLCNKLAHIKEKIFQFKQRKKDLPVLKQQQQLQSQPQPQSKHQHQQHHNNHHQHQQKQHQQLQQPQQQQQQHHHSRKKHQKHKHNKIISNSGFKNDNNNLK